MTEWTEVPLSPTTSDSGLPAVQVMGLGTPLFDLVHITAMSTCGVSTMVSMVILTYMFRTMTTSFWRCTIGERLVVYLSICDLGFSVSHGLDDVIIYSTHDNTPQPTCSIVAWFVQEFTLGQFLVVNIAAVTAVIIIVREKKVSFGKYDMGLIGWAFGFPAVLGAVSGATHLLGPIGACVFSAGQDQTEPFITDIYRRCFMDLRKPAGQALSTFYILAMVTVFVTNSVCYIIVFLKMRNVENDLADFTEHSLQQEGTRRSKKSAQNMTLLVLAFLFQWSLYVAYTMWGFFGNPKSELLVADVFICNLGGVFNGIAYTLMRKFNRGEEGRMKAMKTSEASLNTTLSTLSVSKY